MLKIHDSFAVLPKQQGCYHAFPTLLRAGDRLLLGCRSGVPGRAHGTGGRVRLFRALTGNPARFEEQPLALTPGGPEWNDLDAIVTAMDDELILVSRDYRPHHRGSVPFLTRWPLAPVLGGVEGTLAGERVELSGLITGPLAYRPLATFGHLTTGASGEWLLCSYGLVEADEVPSPVLLSSTDRGARWQVQAVLARSQQAGRYLNEFTVARHPEGGFVAVVRTDQKPFPLFIARSADGVDWSPLAPCALHGHAPMLYAFGGTLLLAYRRVEGEGRAFALARWQDGRFQPLGPFADYTGGLYDGGYGDLVALDEERLLAVTYLADEEDCPWIQGFIFSVGG